MALADREFEFTHRMPQGRPPSICVARSISARDHQPRRWLYFRFPLSLRMVEEMLAARGIVVSHETMRQWALKFGQTLANAIRRRLPRVGDKWHLDEVVVKIVGKTHWLWRAVDEHGVVLDVLVTTTRAAVEALQIVATGATLPVGARPDQ
jgi:transposase-like protein